MLTPNSEMNQSNQQNIKNIRTSKQALGDKKPPLKRWWRGWGWLGLFLSANYRPLLCWCVVVN
ncbi:hypothetical protein, partial [Moraxella pluranimalium]|uniref:hypothetical protein n=1 Tax=Moraxella pluranimalium TaxID=470453 RepID=UPI001B800D1D